MNKDMKPTHDTNKTHESIQDRVFSRITADCVTPRSKYVFWCQNSGMWLIWLLTVVLGGLATAVLIFTSTYRYYDIYEAMHDNFVTYFVQALPILWILASVALMALAMRGLRATRRGYRLSPWVVGGSSVGMSVFFGIAASTLGFGYLVDKTLGEYAPMYYSMADREQKMWQQPDQGRLTGHQIPTELVGQTIVFMDSDGKHWQMNIEELRSLDKELLASNQQVRVLGKESDGEMRYFHACGVFPWMMDKQRPVKELSAGRKDYVEKMYAHSDTPDGKLRELEQAAFDDARADNSPSMKICAEIAAVRRITNQMR
jgi:hypothetical protein